MAAFLSMGRRPASGIRITARRAASPRDGRRAGTLSAAYGTHVSNGTDHLARRTQADGRASAARCRAERDRRRKTENDREKPPGGGRQAMKTILGRRDRRDGVRPSRRRHTRRGQAGRRRGLASPRKPSRLNATTFTPTPVARFTVSAHCHPPSCSKTMQRGSKEGSNTVTRFAPAPCAPHRQRLGHVERIAPGCDALCHSTV